MNDKNVALHLLAQIGNGSQNAFNQFYESYISFVLNIAIQVLKDRNEAEDISHDIFLEVYQNPGQYNPKKGSVKAWLAVKTKSRCIDRLRKSKPLLVHKLEQLDTIEAIEIERNVLKHIQKDLILEALKHLPKKQQLVIYGAYFEDKTQRELAKSLNKPLGTIKSSIRYGLQNLRKQKIIRNWMKTSGE